MWTIVNSLKWENVFSALGSSHKFSWNSISLSTFSNQVSKNYPKEASASSNLKWINNFELAGPVCLLFCPQIKFCAEFEEIDNRVFCSLFSELNLQEPVFFAILLFRFTNHLFSFTYSKNPWEAQVMRKFNKFYRILYKNGMFIVLEWTTTTWLSDFPRQFIFSHFLAVFSN